MVRSTKGGVGDGTSSSGKPGGSAAGDSQMDNQHDGPAIAPNRTPTRHTLKSESGKDDGRKRRYAFNYRGLARQLNPKEMVISFFRFWRDVPHVLWTFFIDAFVIPA